MTRPLTMPQELSPQEKAAIGTLRRLAKRWPSSLWLFSASGRLHVMRCNANRERAYRESGADPDFIVEKIDIPNDGGDW
jgi:hypothetical protein